MCAAATAFTPCLLFFYAAEGSQRLMAWFASADVEYRHALATWLTAKNGSGSVSPLTGEISSLTMLPIVVFSPVLQTIDKVFLKLLWSLCITQPMLEHSSTQTFWINVIHHPDRHLDLAGNTCVEL